MVCGVWFVVCGFGLWFMVCGERRGEDRMAENIKNKSKNKNIKTSKTKKHKNRRRLKKSLCNVCGERETGWQQKVSKANQKNKTSNPEALFVQKAGINPVHSAISTVSCFDLVIYYYYFVF